jgi:hypothetical protein
MRSVRYKLPCIRKTPVRILVRLLLCPGGRIAMSDRDKKVGVFRNRLPAWVARVKRAIVQDCPPELYACEVCGRLECNDAQWVQCEQRIAAAEFMRSSN